MARKENSNATARNGSAPVLTHDIQPPGVVFKIDTQDRSGDGMSRLRSVLKLDANTPDDEVLREAAIRLERAAESKSIFDAEGE